MQAKKSILSVALVAVFAAAGSALAYGPGYGPGPQGGGKGMMGPRGGAAADPAAQLERVQARLGEVRSALKLQDSQLDAWNAYAAKVAAEAQSRAQMRQGMMEHRGDAQAMADHRVTMMKHNAQAAEEVNTLRKALVATLSAEQKATFDQYAIGPQFARGPGHGHGHGPGYGRGCMGAA